MPSWLTSFFWVAHVLLGILLLWLFVSIVQSSNLIRNWATKPEGPWKNVLASLVVIGSFFILIILIVFVMGTVFRNEAGKPPFDAVSELSIQLIGIILPVLGTWVGTVLAFYFARENFEAAEQAFLRSRRQPRQPISDFMVPIAEISVFDNIDDREDKITLKQIRDRIKYKPLRRAIFTLNDGTVKYIIHGETIDQAITNKLTDKNAAPLCGDTSLYDFLNNFDMDPKIEGIQIYKVLAERFRSVSRNGGLLECKEMFDQDPALENIVVTDTGDKAKEKPLGLITRDSLGKVAVEMSA